MYGVYMQAYASICKHIRAYRGENMNNRTIKVINEFLGGLQAAAEINDKQFANIHKNVKRIVAEESNGNTQVIDILRAIDMRVLIKKSEWYAS